MKRHLNKIHYSKKINFQDNLFKGVLSVFSSIYELVINIRNTLYERNMLDTYNLDAKVISVGNLTTGGTGKTPITVEIARALKEKGAKVAILSHGYGGGLLPKNTNVICNGSDIRYTPLLAGDEPYWMAINTIETVVITGKNRAKSGDFAIKEFGCDTFVLDDGFQHRKLGRDLNILVIDANKQFGNNKVLPAGPLREPVSQINRADKIVVVNKKPFDEDSTQDCIDYAEQLKQETGKPVFIANFNTVGIYDILSKEPLVGVDKIFAFAGIAQPEFFYNSLKEKNLEVVGTKDFIDHYQYTIEDLIKIIEEAIEKEAQAIITTEKDAVKLQTVLDEINEAIESFEQLPLYALRLGVDLNVDELLEDKRVVVEDEKAKDTCS